MTSTPLARDAYNAWHERYEVDRDAATPWHRLVIRHLDAERDLKGRRVLEIACGRGGFAATLAHMTNPPPRLVAADFSAAAVRKASAFASRGARPAAGRGTRARQAAAAALDCAALPRRRREARLT